ncbi:MAG: GCN5-related N-acetyltransferase [Parcubacteria group bacterium]|nr:GCN5-related N-acetyltransferase [Parcubacteria group bacterium]
MTSHYIAYGTSKVVLAAMQREYIPHFIPFANDLSIVQGTLMTPPFTIEDEYAWYDRISKKNPANEIFAILYRGSDSEPDEYRYIGHTGLHQIRWPGATAHTGSVIIDKSLHGKGCGTEAKLLLLHHAFYVKGLRKVRSEVKAFNGNSWGHLLKCGYKVIGRDTDFHFHDGSYVDEILLSVSREDFEPIWEEYKSTGLLPTLTEAQKKLIATGTK